MKTIFCQRGMMLFLVFIFLFLNNSCTKVEESIKGDWDSEAVYIDEDGLEGDAFLHISFEKYGKVNLNITGELYDEENNAVLYLDMIGSSLSGDYIYDNEQALLDFGDVTCEMRILEINKTKMAVSFFNFKGVNYLYWFRDKKIILERN